MSDSIAGTKHAEKLFTGKSGATMDEVIAATGGPQYNVLRRLEAKGYTIRKMKEGRATRYYAQPPGTTVYEMAVNDKGQVTLPKGLRDEMRVYAGQKLEASVQDGKVTIAPKTTSIQDLFGILGKPPKGAGATVEDMNEAIKRHAVERYLRAVRK